MIDFDGVVSHVCSPTGVCVEKNNVETLQWHLSVSSMNLVLHVHWTNADPKMDLVALPIVKPHYEKRGLLFFTSSTRNHTLAVVAEGTQPKIDLLQACAMSGTSSRNNIR
jgi:hypothetical protein